MLGRRVGERGPNPVPAAKRLIEPASKLATTRALDETTAPHSLGATLGLGRVAAKEIYATLDWLGGAQEVIERDLARRHLSEGTLVLMT